MWNRFRFWLAGAILWKLGFIRNIRLSGYDRLLIESTFDAQLQCVTLEARKDEPKSGVESEGAAQDAECWPDDF